MTTTALLVMTDGRRECIEPTIASAEANLQGDITHRFIHDDSEDPAYRSWLWHRFPTYSVIGTRTRKGFGGAIASAWRYVRRFDYVLHLEDDFTFNRPVDLEAMKLVLAATPHLQQLALRRQPWNEEERHAGGIVECHPADYTDVFLLGHAWLEHRRFFTTNPSLYRGSLCQRGWPEGAESEGHFGIALFADPQATCGYWGARDSGEWVTHIGRERAGVGY